MKNFIYLTTIATAVSSLLLPGVAIAQSVFVQGFPSNGFPSNGFPSNGFPSNGYSSTTIYIPSTETTTTVERVNSNIYPGSNSVTTSTTTTYTGGSFRNRRQQGQSTVIFQNLNPRNTQVNCTTSIIGSPIPSPVALNPVTGGLCR
jgi:hypothetical protein